MTFWLVANICLVNKKNASIFMRKYILTNVEYYHSNNQVSVSLHVSDQKIYIQNKCYSVHPW